AAALLVGLILHRRSHAAGKPELSMPALFLFDALVSLTLAFVSQLLPAGRGETPHLTAATSAGVLAFWAVYVRLLSLDPGLILLEPAKADAARAEYWAAVERLPAGHFSPVGFCLDSEQLRRVCDATQLVRALASGTTLQTTYTTTTTLVSPPHHLLTLPCTTILSTPPNHHIRHIHQPSPPPHHHPPHTPTPICNQHIGTMILGSLS
ncbi:MAG: hypothetical protein SGPRY_014159, partial [Prymnesium sp.]